MAQPAPGTISLTVAWRRLVWGAVLIGLLLVWTIPAQAARKAQKTALKKATVSKTRHLKPDQKAIPDFVAFKPELEKFLGTPYRLGGTGSAGMDCSGFTKTFFSEAFGIELPHNSRAISHLDFLQELPRDWDLYRPSDLLFFGNSKGRINHVGIYLGEGKFIHASRSSGVVVSNLESSYWKRRLVASKRVTLLDDSLVRDPGDTGMDEAAWETPTTVALGYSHALLDDRLNLGLDGFYGEVGPFNGGAIDAAAQQRRLTYRSPIDHYEGWQARLSISPSAWLRITPSVSNMEVADLLGESSGSLRTYGIATRVAQANSPWWLSVAAQTSHFRDDSDVLQEGSGAWQSLDLSLDIGYRLADGFNLSVSGSHSNLYSGDETADQKHDLPANLSDVSLRLKIDF